MKLVRLLYVLHSGTLVIFSGYAPLVVVYMYDIASRRGVNYCFCWRKGVGVLWNISGYRGVLWDLMIFLGILMIFSDF